MKPARTYILKPTEGSVERMRKPLYVSDLDGTLMRSDKTISQYSAGIINRLIAGGVCFTIATARTIRSASRIIRDIGFSLPVITLNGTVLADARTEKPVDVALFSPEETEELRRLLHGQCGNLVVKSYRGEELHRTYLRGEPDEAFSAYLGEHAYDPLMGPADTEEEMFAGRVCYLSLIAAKEKLEELHRAVSGSGRWETLFQKDTYLPYYWLEIFPRGASKAEAILKLKERCGCDGVVMFGDSINDLPAFRIADECYAVRGASEEVKAAATAVIGGNDEDAVAEWLLRNAGGAG